MVGIARETMDDAELAARVSTLTPREKDCLRLVAAPMRTPQIAHQLGLTPNTVNTYISNAFRKLGAADRDTAARLLLRHDRTSEKIRPDFQRLDPSADLDASTLGLRPPWPWPPRGRTHNDLTVPQRVIAILIAAAILLGGAGIYIAAVAALNATF